MTLAAMSIYITSREFDLHRAKTRFEMLCGKGATVELTEKKPLRSIPQNRYLHLILCQFALEYGETLEYVKQQLFKAVVNPEIFKYERVNRKTGEVREALRSSRLLDTREMTVAIDRFRNWASIEAGIYLPDANEYKYLEQIDRDIKSYDNQLYL
jgi:hypothetical protein